MATIFSILGAVFAFTVIAVIIYMAGMAFTDKMGPIESLKHLWSKIKGE